jgi:hypothetical protein
VILELAKAGLANNGLPLTLKQLQEVESNFKDTRPVSIGHVKSDKQPKWGDVLSAKVIGDRLIGEVNLHPKAQALYDEGHFNKWSVGLKDKPDDRSLYMHHFSLLGAVPPAIEGLQEYGNEDCKLILTYDFADSKKEERPDQAGAGPENNNKTEVKTMPAKGLLENDKVIKMQAELDKLRLENKQFSDSVENYKKSEKQNKLDALKKAMAGKAPEAAINNLLEFADHFDFEAMNFSDKKQRDFFDLMSEVFNEVKPLVQTGRQLDFSDSDNESTNVNDTVKYM